MRDSYTAFFAGSCGMDMRPFSIAFSTCGGGKFSTISFVLIFSVRKGASRDSTAPSSILSGWSCSSNHLSSPSVCTRSTSLGRTPKVKRLSAWTIRLSSSICTGATAGALESGCLDLDFLSPANSTAVEISTMRPSRINCLRTAGIDAPGTLLFRDINPRLCKSCGENERLRQCDPAPGHATVQFGNHMIDIRRRDVTGYAGVKEHFSCPDFP